MILSKYLFRYRKPIYSSLYYNSRFYWQQVKKGDKVYYVDTDTFKQTTEKPEEYVPFEAMESRLVRGLKMDQWGDPLKPVPKWQNRLGYILFTGCSCYLIYNITYSKYEEKKKNEKEENLRKEREKKRLALQMQKQNQKN